MNSDILNKISEYGLSLEQYENCLSDAYNKANHVVDMDWQEIIDKYNLNIHYDTLRKATQTIFGGAFVSEYYKGKQASSGGDNGYYNDIQSEKEELRKEKQRLFDERAELNRKLRNQARAENDLQYLANIISEKSKGTLPVVTYKSIDSEKDMIVCVSDFHLGMDNDNRFGQYNSTIAAERLSKYASKIAQLQSSNQARCAYVLFLGDLINGEIHLTSQLENRENLTDQIKAAGDLLSSFIHRLSSIFEHVYINGVAGNHSRTSYKDEVLRGNRLDNLIPWYMKASLSHIKNVSFIEEDNYDATIGHIRIFSKDYIIVHGDWDAFNEAAISKLVLMIGYKPAAVLMGHMHHNSYDDVSGVKIVRSGSFSGTGDDYSITKRLYGKPSQMALLLENGEITCCYPIDL